jgi:hypothetical protein
MAVCSTVAVAAEEVDSHLPSNHAVHDCISMAVNSSLLHHCLAVVGMYSKHICLVCLLLSHVVVGPAWQPPCDGHS